MKKVFLGYIGLIIWLYVGGKKEKKIRMVLRISEHNVGNWVDDCAFNLEMKY